MPNSRKRPHGRSSAAKPSSSIDGLAPEDFEPPDLDKIYEESLTECDPDWMERYGEADWYAAITLFGLFSVGDDTPIEDIPEEYRWRGPSRRTPPAS